MSFRQMVKKLYYIIKGNLKRIFNLYNEESTIRYITCMSCSDKNNIPIFGDYCTHCGCPIKSKITVKEERCPKNLW